MQANGWLLMGEPRKESYVLRVISSAIHGCGKCWFGKVFNGIAYFQQVAYAHAGCGRIAPSRNDIVNEWIIHPFSNFMASCRDVLKVSRKNAGRGISGIRKCKELTGGFRDGAMKTNNAAVAYSVLIGENISCQQDRERGWVEVSSRQYSIHYPLNESVVNESHRRAVA